MSEALRCLRCFQRQVRLLASLAARAGVLGKLCCIANDYKTLPFGAQKSSRGDVNCSALR